MGRLRFFYLAVLLTGALLEAEAQESFVDRFKNFFQTLADDIQTKFDEFKTAMGDKFDSLSEKLKNFFNNRDFSSATAADLVAELKGGDWKKLEPSMLMTMPKVEAEKLVTLGVAKDIPPRFLSELKRLMIANMTDAELAVSVKTKLPMLNADEISTLLQRLGPVNTWTSANISSFGTYILRVPVCFDDANDEKVLQNVLDLVNNCDTSSPPTGCPSRSQLDYIRLPVTMKLSGVPKNWKMSDVERMMPTYTDIPSFTIRSTSDSFVQDMKAKLKAAQNLPTDSSPELEAWMMEICRVDGCSSMSATEATAWYNGLGSMKTAVTPSDVSQAAREDAKLSVQLEANAKAKVPMRAMDAAILLDMKLNKEQPDSITNIGGKMAVWAPACYLWGAAENKTLSSVMTDVTSRLGSQQGPEHMAKVNAALKSTMEQALTNNGGFKMSVVNNYLKPYILSDYLEEQSSSTVLSVVKLADANNIQPNPYQMHAMIKKISATDSQESPAALKERLPVSFMASVSTSVLARLDEGMMGVTLPCLLGAKKMFTSKTSLQPTDIANGKEFLKCMSFDDASKVDSSEIFEVFEEVLDEDMSWSACRAFDEKLTEWAKNNLNIGDSENLEDVVNRLFLHEIYKIPACVMIAYEPVIYKTNNQVKKAVMNNLCSAKNYFSIPRDARRRVVNTLLPQTMDGPITVCGMRRINFCFVDLNSNMLQKMDEGATASYISLLEEFLKRRIPLCLDSGQRDEVAEMVLQMKGPAATWKTASDVSCILDTLSSSGIDRIAADMPAEVLITTECPKRDDTFRSMPLQGNCKREVEEARMRMKNRKVERCVRLRETFGTNNGTCDSVMCGNILRMTSSQLERMNKQEVVRLLDSLATEDVDTAKAKVVLAKVKEVKPLKDMSVTELQRLKYAWRGLSKQDVENLPTLTSAHREVIFQLGMTTGLPDDVMIALRDKIIQDYKPPSSMDDTDVFLLGGLVCYLTQDQVNAIPNQVFKRSMRNLGVRECKNATTTYHLATKAAAAYGKSPSNWDAAMVHESGVLVAGLRPEDLAVIPHQAYIGFTSSGISKIDTEAIKVMTVAQASNLDGPTAAAITSSQIGVLDSNVQLAITNANSEELGNGASDVSVPRVLVAVATILLLLLH